MEGFQETSSQNTDFPLSIRMITALTFAPSRDVIELFEQPEDTLPEEADSILDYFEKYLHRSEM